MTKLRLWLGLLLLITGVANPQEDTLIVNAAQSLGAISPYVYGASYGPWAVVSPEMTPLAADSGLTFFRFPGGNWGDQNDIQPYHLDLFMLQARAWGAEPSISTRMVNGTPEQSAALVHYVNIEKDYNIRYWSIGNEPTLYDDYTIDRFNEEWRAHVEAMLEIDPNILLIGPEIHQYTPTEDPNHYNAHLREWLREFLRANGDLVDYVSIHRYPFPASNQSSANIADLRSNTAEADTIIAVLRQDIQEAVGWDMPIAVTEINSHWTNTGGGEASPDSFYNAIWWADVLGRFIRQKVEIVSYFALSASVQSGLGMLARYEPRPTYYVYQIYQHFGTELLNAESTDPDVSIYAARRDDGVLTFIVINLGPAERSMTLQLDGFTPGDDAEVWRFDAEHNAERIGTESIGNESTVAIPGQSITLYIVP